MLLQSISVRYLHLLEDPLLSDTGNTLKLGDELLGRVISQKSPPPPQGCNFFSFIGVALGSLDLS